MSITINEKPSVQSIYRYDGCYEQDGSSYYFTIIYEDDTIDEDPIIEWLSRPNKLYKQEEMEKEILEQFNKQI